MFLNVYDYFCDGVDLLDQVFKLFLAVIDGPCYVEVEVVEVYLVTIAVLV